MKYKMIVIYISFSTVTIQLIIIYKIHIFDNMFQHLIAIK